jgi:MipA family protein
MPKNSSHTWTKNRAKYLPLLLLVAFSGNANAADKDALYGGKSDVPQKDWNFALGAGVGMGADYEGSDDYKPVPLPIVSMSYKNYVFIDGPSLRLNGMAFFGDEFPVVAGPMVAYGGGRSHKDNKALKNLGDVKAGLDSGGFVMSQLGPISVGATFMREIGDDRDGLYGDVNIGYMHPLSESLTANVGLVATWGDDNYMQEYFGITASQSLASGYSVHNGKAGFKSAGINVGLDYRLTENISVSLNAGYSQMLGNAADSPLVKKEGSKDQYSVGLSTSYSF